MTQATGGSAQIAYVEESTYGTTPGAPSMKLLRAAGFGESLSSTTEELTSNAISGSGNRTVQDMKAGNKDAGGAIPFELSIDGIGTLIKHALGTATTGRAVTNQPTNVTGVVVDYASSGAASGNGTLTYTNSGTTLAWAENGDTAGAAQDVSAGGIFTLASNNAETLTVHVTAGSLPGSDQSDTDITVSGTLYTHTIKRGALPTGLSIEKGFTDIAQYFVYAGCKIESMQMSLNPTGLIAGSFEVKAKGESASGTPLDASPDDPGFAIIAHHEADLVQEGGSAATILGFDVTIANNLDTDKYYVGSQSRASLPEGQGQCNGSISFMFEDLTYYNKWANNTETSLKVRMTQGTDSITFYFPRVRYTGEAAPKIDTAGGLLTPMNWRALNDTTENSDVVVTITNAESSV